MIKKIAVALTLVIAAAIGHYSFLGKKSELVASQITGAGRETVELFAGTTAYESANLKTDKPVVVLVGDLVFNAAIWENTFNELKRARLPAIRYDVYGSGYSARPKVRYDTDLFSRQLNDLLRKVIPGRKIILCASSGGAFIAAAYGELNTDSLQKIIFLAPMGLEINMPLKAKMMKTPLLGA